jgi:acyl-CoA synthetase (AMP-forming)/AMP-acid ligase II
VDFVASRYSESIATHSGELIYQGQSFSYAQFSDDIHARKKQILDSGVPPQSAIALISDYSYLALVTLFALYEAGHICVPLVPDRESVLTEKIKAAGCTAVIDAKSEDKIHSLPDEVCGPRPEIYNALKGPGLVLFSSGTTGKPKGMLYDLDTFIQRVAIQPAQRPIRTALVLVFDHMGGLDALFSLLARGATVVLDPVKNPVELAKAIQTYALNFISVSPSFLALMLAASVDEHYNITSLKTVNYGAEPMPEALLKRVQDRWPTVQFRQTLGTSETGTVSIASDQQSTRFYAKSDDLRVVDGELWIRSRVGFLGYLNPENGGLESGWFKTGDLVETFEDGAYRIIGRKQEVINVGGNKVIPTEIEALISELPEVADVRVYGLPNPLLGHVVAADVHLQQDIPLSQLKSKIRTHILSKTEAFKVPTKVTLVEQHDLGARFKKKRI